MGIEDQVKLAADMLRVCNLHLVRNKRGLCAQRTCPREIECEVAFRFANGMRRRGLCLQHAYNHRKNICFFWRWGKDEYGITVHRVGSEAEPVQAT